MADTKKQQALASELSSKLWAMANDLRGNMEAYEFKNYILGLLFYKELSDRTVKFVAKLLEEDGIGFEEAWEDEEYKEAIVDEMLIKLGYVLEPKYLFPRMLDLIRKDEFSIDYFEEGINSIIEKINVNGNGYTNFFRFRNRIIFSINKNVPIKFKK